MNAYLKSEDNVYFKEGGWGWYWDGAQKGAHRVVCKVLLFELGNGYTYTPLTIVH